MRTAASCTTRSPPRFTNYLLACVGTGPALVLVEDMHWFDEDTIEIVQALLSEDLGRPF